jgi:hypothetical protein
MDEYKRERDANGVNDPSVTAELLPLGDAALVYDIPTRELVDAWYDRTIDFRIVDGLIFLPREAVKEFKRQREALD